MALTQADWTNVVLMALVVYREARSESSAARLGVAFAVMNRVAKPGWWGKTVREVLFKPWQFSSVTAHGNPELLVWPTEQIPADEAAWEDCLNQSLAAYQKTKTDPTDGADSYYDISIPAPVWASSETFTVQIGKLRFYETAA